MTDRDVMGLILTVVTDPADAGSVWRVPQTPEEAERMRGYVQIVDDVAGTGPSGRCGTCAFRPHTDANNSQMVLRLVERCLRRGGTFMCHAGLSEYRDPIRVCAGFVALRRAMQRRKQTMSERSRNDGRNKQGTLLEVPSVSADSTGG
jgi:hypothetical protein